MPDMRQQRWGLELEFTGISRYQAALAAAELFGTSHQYSSDQTASRYVVKDSQNRQWTFMGDGSIKPQQKVDGEIVRVGNEFAVELVTPICTYADIETLQELVRKLRKAGAFVNPSCGIHVHVDGANHTPRSIRNIINIVASKNDLLYKSLGILPERKKYCEQLDSHLIEQMHRFKPQTMERIADIWYRGYSMQRDYRYHDSRYHFLNLHSFLNGNGTLEFRGFNATLHAGKVKSYIQLSLAMCHQAKIQKSASRMVTQTDNPKYTFRTYLLRLGLIGDEFKTARQHLLEPLPGNIAWRDPAQAERQRERMRQAREQLTQQPAEQTPEPAMEPDFSL